MSSDFSLWVYLSQKPLTWLTLTLIAYAVADRLAAATKRHPLANPVLLAVALVGIVLFASGTPYRQYFEGAQFVHFLLGPATVALAVPLYEHRAEVLRSLLPMAAALIAGAVVTLASVIVIMVLLGAPLPVIASIAPKSVTAAIAMGVSEGLGGDPALTAVLVILTGVFGAIIVTPLLDSAGIQDWRARGFAAGIAAHGIGTARALQVNPVAGTFAAIAMALNAVFTALLTPLALKALSG
ncbi:MAG TPA: LrgB family protein [Beijerinckiaceae bacterium]|nr:LrgB family protein [Beijerinckiaceae bacterium]